MILFRCFAWNRRAAPEETDGALWFPRVFQGDGRHDNPDIYGCLYVSERAVSSVAEQLARFRGQRLTRGMLRRRRLQLAVAAIELPDDTDLVDLDEPRTLAAEGLRPSVVATRARRLTQPQALDLFRDHAAAAGLRWWSTVESLWANVTLFDRAATGLSVADVHALTVEDAIVVEAAELLGIG